MKYLLDSDAIINHLRSKITLDPRFFVAGAGISVITEGELLYGIQKSQKKEAGLALLFKFFDDVSIEILPLSSEIISRYVHTRVALEQVGKPLDQFDLLIASTALAYSLELVTYNKKHFERIKGLQIYSE